MQKSRFFISAVLLASFVLTVACSKETNVKSNKINLKSILGDSELSSAEKAEELALAAERLAFSNGVVYAYPILEQALQLDASNTRAKLYKALLTPIELQRGIRSRLSNLENQAPGILNSFDEKLNAPRRNNSIPKFLKQNRKADLQSEAAIQSHIDKMQLAYLKLRDLLLDLRSTEFTVNLPGDIAENLRRKDRYCTIEVENDEYTIEANGDNDPVAIEVCNFELERTIKLNVADFEVMRQYAGGIVASLSLANLYKLDGSFTAYGSKEKKHEEIYKKLSTNTSFATIRGTENLKLIKLLGADYLASLKWAIQQQDDLCPYGHSEHFILRPGYLVEKGICMRNTGIKTIEDIGNVLSGKQLVIEASKGFDEFEINSRPLSFLDNPIQDLKTLNPTFTSCNDIVSINNQSLNGLLPDNNADELLNNIRGYCEE